MIFPEKYCVYKHFKDGELFYIGKGRAERALSVTADRIENS